MLHVKVIKAENLPDTKKKISKTKIYCYSSSSRCYYLDSFKNKDKKARYNGEFDIDLYRASYLSFSIYGWRLLTKKVFIGLLDIDLSELLSQDIGKQIFNNPNTVVEHEFPIKTSESSNATLTLSFSYSPSIYPMIDFKDIPKPTVHFWATYNPPISLTDCKKLPVEIELLQADPIYDKNSGDLNLFYTIFNKFSCWNSIGGSSNTRTFPLSTGLSQVHTFKLSRVADKYEFFLLNVSNYNGQVTLNFIEEKRGKVKTLKFGSYYRIKSCKDNIGTLKAITVKVEPNKIYCCPQFMYYDKKFLEKTMNFVSFPMLSYDKEKLFKDSNKSIEYSDTINSHIQFMKDIFDKAQNSVSELKDVHFIRLNVLSNTEPISLQKMVEGYNVKCSNLFRLYIGGSSAAENSNQDHGKSSSPRGSNQLPVLNYWEPFFISYDAKNGNECPEISKDLLSSINLESSFPSGFNFNGIKTHTAINVDLNKVEHDKIVVFGVSCKSPLNSAKQAGFYLISHVDNDDKETLLFRESVFSDVEKSHYAVCLRFVYQNNEWKIIPMRHFESDIKEIHSFVDTLKANNWDAPSILYQSNGIDSDDSDK